MPHVVPVPYIGYSQNQNIKMPHVVHVPYIGYSQNQNIKMPHVVHVPYIGYSQNQNIKMPHVVPVPYIGYSQNQNIKIPHVVPVLCDCVFPTLRPECAVQSSAILLFNVAMRLYGYYCNWVITCQIVFAASNQRDIDHCQLKTLNV